MNVQVTDIILASGDFIDSRSKIQLPVGLQLSDFSDDDAINKRALAGITGGGHTIVAGPKIASGTPIPYFLNAADFTDVDNTYLVVAKATTYDPTSGAPTGRLKVYYDIDAEEQDSVGDGTGAFTGWNIYGHDDGSGNFKEDTYITLI